MLQFNSNFVIVLLHIKSVSYKISLHSSNLSRLQSRRQAAYSKRTGLSAEQWSLITMASFSRYIAFIKTLRSKVRMHFFLNSMRRVLCSHPQSCALQMYWEFVFPRLGLIVWHTRPILEQSWLESHCIKNTSFGIMYSCFYYTAVPTLFLIIRPKYLS